MAAIGNGTAKVSPLPANSKIIYLSTKLTKGNLGASPAAAITAADAICNSDPHNPTYATGSFKALIVATGARIACTTANCSGGVSEHTNWPLAASTQYAFGLAFSTTNASGLFTSINATNVLAKYGFGAWSGLDENSGNEWLLDATANCADWSSNSSGDYGWYFDPTQTNITSMYDTSANSYDTCDVLHPLICVEQ